MGDAMPQLVLDTLARVAGADDLAARGAGPDFIGREDRRGLQIATGPAFPADQASRRVGAAQMRRAVDLPIDDAHGLMRRADRLAAARALRHLVHAHRLAGAALTGQQARRAQTAAAFRRIRVALLGVTVADDPPAAAAGRETCRAGRVPALRADSLVHRAVRHAAGLADACVLLAGGLLIDAAPRDAVVRAEVLGADGAARRAGLTAAVVVAADHERRRPAAAKWTGADPRGPPRRALGPPRPAGPATSPARPQ